MLVADGVAGDGERAARLLLEGRLPEGIVELPLQDLGEVRRPRDLAAALSRGAPLSHLRCADSARLPAPLHLLHLPASGGRAPAASPSRGRGRRDGAAPSPPRRRGAVRRGLVVQRRREPHDGRLRGAARAAQPARRRLGGRQLLLLRAAARKRTGRVRPACGRRLHVRRLRHRQAAEELLPALGKSFTAADLRDATRWRSRRGSTCVTRWSSAVPARRRAPWPRRCASPTELRRRRWWRWSVCASTRGRGSPRWPLRRASSASGSRCSSRGSSPPDTPRTTPHGVAARAGLRSGCVPPHLVSAGGARLERGLGSSLAAAARQAGPSCGATSRDPAGTATCEAAGPPRPRARAGER